MPAHSTLARPHITATTRSCAICHRLISPEMPGCAHCGTVLCPVIADWPPDLQEFLRVLRMRQEVEHMAGLSDQTRWEFVLRNAYAGQRRPGRVMPYTMTALDCYPFAVCDMEAWIRVGKPHNL